MPSHRGHIELGVWSLLAVVVVLTGTLLYLPRAPPLPGGLALGTHSRMAFALTSHGWIPAPLGDLMLGRWCRVTGL